MAKVKKIPQRKCVGCQAMKNKRELIRVIRTPEEEIIVDLTGKKSGRGVYICINQECLNNALKGNRLGKALERSIPPEITRQLSEVISSAQKDL